MSKNIEMNIKQSTGTYEILYPATTGLQVSGTVSSATTASSCTGNAATATKLATSRTIRTNLASTSTASFDGSSNITPGVNGVLPVANGGTGSSTEKYLPLTGGTLSGNLTLKGSGNYGTAINLGDGDYVHISEPTDDCLEIKAKQVNFVLSNTSSSTQFTINGSSPFQSGNSTTGITRTSYTGTGSSTQSITKPSGNYWLLLIMPYNANGILSSSNFGIAPASGIAWFDVGYSYSAFTGATPITSGYGTSSGYTPATVVDGYASYRANISSTTVTISYSYGYILNGTTKATINNYLSYTGVTYICYWFS